MKNLKAKFKIPKMTTKKVWYGAYGGHYDCMVFFKEKPETVESNSNDREVSLWKQGENNNICGAMWPDEFEILTGIKIIPDEIAITETYEIELTAPWDEDGKLWGYANNADGWV